MTDPASEVWLFHGSSGANGLGGWASSEVPVGAHLPFGGMRLGPDTTVCWEGLDFWWLYNHYGGYFFNDTCIRAISHTHLQGAGLADAGSVGVMLSRGLPAAASLPSVLDPAPYRVPLNHSSEVGRPGYYAVDLPGLEARAELTVSGLRSGMHRYTCRSSSGRPCVLLIDACHRNHDKPCGPGSLQLAGSALAVNATEGGSFGGDCGGVPVYLTLALEAQLGSGGGPVAPTASGRWVEGVQLAGDGGAASNGTLGSLGAWLAYPAPPPGEELVILVRVGLSHVSSAGAQGNVQAEQQGLTLGFEEAAAAAYAAWGSRLSSVTINDVGYSQSEFMEQEATLAAHVASSSAFAQHMQALLSLPSSSSSSSPGRQAAVAASARAAARVHLQQLQQQRQPAAAGAAPTPVTEDSITAFLAAAPAPAHTLAGHATSLPGLGLPPRPRGMPPSDRVRSFYSTLYHSFAAPTTYSDVDGRYPALGGGVGSVSWGGAWLSDLSLWDVYRSQTPLLALLAPAAASDLFFSALADYNATGKPPHWVFANCETGCMPGSHGLAVLADFLVKGVKGPSPQLVLQAAIAGLTPQDSGEYSALGFVPLESSKDCTSLTLDFAFDVSGGGGGWGCFTLKHLSFMRSRHTHTHNTYTSLHLRMHAGL